MTVTGSQPNGGACVAIHQDSAKAGAPSITDAMPIRFQRLSSAHGANRPTVLAFDLIEKGFGEKGLRALLGISFFKFVYFLKRPFSHQNFTSFQSG